MDYWMSLSNSWHKFVYYIIIYFYLQKKSFISLSFFYKISVNLNTNILFYIPKLSIIFNNLLNNNVNYRRVHHIAIYFVKYSWITNKIRRNKE